MKNPYDVYVEAYEIAETNGDVENPYNAIDFPLHYDAWNNGIEDSLTFRAPLARHGKKSE